MNVFWSTAVATIKVPSVAEPLVKSRVTVLPIAIPCFVIVTVIVVDDDCE